MPFFLLTAVGAAICRWRAEKLEEAAEARRPYRRQQKTRAEKARSMLLCLLPLHPGGAARKKNISQEAKTFWPIIQILFT